jgi:hypothetical protein
MTLKGNEAVAVCGLFPSPRKRGEGVFSIRA